MKTKSIRAKIEDAKKIEQVSRELAVLLERTVTVSEIVEELTKGIESAKKRIEKGNDKTS